MEISGKSTEPAPANLPTYSRQRSFGEQLSWHVKTFGTRPTGSPSKIGKPWKVHEFAEAVLRDDRAVRNWYRNKNVPYHLDAIEKALFGSNSAFDEWRIDLREAAEKLQKTTNPGATRQNEIKTTYRNFIPPRLTEFVGRQKELDAIEAIIFANMENLPSSAVTIHGLAGTGKTFIAIELVNRLHNKFFGVWWCTASSRSKILLSLHEFAKLFYREIVDPNSQEITARQLMDVLCKDQNNWLLIYDNVESPIDVAGLLPITGSKTIITSQFSDWTDVGVSFELDCMNLDEAVCLLEKTARRNDRAGALGLANILGNLPVALNHAAVTCRRMELDFQKYSRHVADFIDECPSGIDYPKSVYATFRFFFQIFESWPKSQELMLQLGFFESSIIPFEVIISMFDTEAEAFSALVRLRNFSLAQTITNSSNRRFVSVHSLIQIAARAHARICGVEEKCCSVIFQSIYGKLPKMVPFDKKDREIYWDCIDHIWRFVFIPTPDVLKSSEYQLLIFRTIQFLRDEGCHSFASDVCGQAIEVAWRLIDQDPFIKSTNTANWKSFFAENYNDHYKQNFNKNAQFKLRLFIKELQLKYINVVERFLFLSGNTKYSNRNFEIVVERTLVSALVCEGPKSYEVCKLLLMLAEFKLINGEKLDSEYCIGIAKSIYASRRRDTDFVASEFSFDLLKLLIPDIEERRQFLFDQFVALSEAERASLPQSLSTYRALSLSFLEECLAVECFIVLKFVYRNLCNDIGRAHPLAIKYYCRLGMILIGTRWGQLGSQIFAYSLSALDNIFGEENFHSYEMKCEYYRIHLGAQVIPMSYAPISEE